MYDGEHVDGQETQKQQKNAQLLLQKATAPNGHFQITLDGLDVLAVYRVSQKTGWTTIVSIPLDRILSPVEKNRNRLIFTTLSIIAFALVVATFISHALTKPLKSMVRLMKQVQHGNLDVWLHPKYNDEIGMLGSHFNRMIIRVKDLPQEVSLTEKRKQRQICGRCRTRLTRILFIIRWNPSACWRRAVMTPRREAHLSARTADALRHCPQ